jgi:hypothetical protein
MAVDPFDQRHVTGYDRSFSIHKGFPTKPMKLDPTKAAPPKGVNAVLGHDMTERDKAMVKVLGQAVKALEAGNKQKAMDLLTKCLRAKSFTPAGVHSEVERMLNEAMSYLEAKDMDDQAMAALKDEEGI